MLEDAPDPYRLGRPLTRFDVMTAAEVAELLGDARATVMAWAQTGAIPSRRSGRARRFIRPEIQAWILGEHRSS